MDYDVKISDEVRFNNKADHCVGTGRMDLALHKEYYDQLKIVQDEIGFSYIRGHGLFRETWQFTGKTDGQKRMSTVSLISIW